MLCVKQGGIKYHFLSAWYDSTEDWTPVSRTIGEHATKATVIIFNIIRLHTVKWFQVLLYNTNDSI